MTRPLDGKCALVTGSVRGLGLAAAERLAAHGCDVVLNGFDAAEDVGAIRARIAREHGVTVLYDAADLRNPAAIEAMIATAAAACGSVDIVVNTAVVRHVAPVETFDATRWDEALAVNLSAAFHTIRFAMPHMQRRGWGRIVNVSSIYGLRGAANRVGYVTSKTALLGLTRAVAMETAGRGITCNAVCPGTSESPIHEASLVAMMAAGSLSRAAAERQLLASKQPSGRLVGSRQVAALIAFLCGPEADDINGAALPIDGGWSAS
jgi:3-hydroxybutyrate dehydrogenase